MLLTSNPLTLHHLNYLFIVDTLSDTRKNILTRPEKFVVCKIYIKSFLLCCVFPPKYYKENIILKPLSGKFL